MNSDEEEIYATSVTIELDLKKQDRVFESLEDVTIGEPIETTIISAKTPKEFIFNDLTREIKNIISTNLNIPPFVSVANWFDISVKLNIPNSEIMAIEAEQNPCLSFMEAIRKVPAYLVFEALEFYNRADILYLCQQIIDLKGLVNERVIKNDYLITPGTDNDDDDALPRRVKFEEVVLVNHYEDGAQERKNYRWFMKNLKFNLVTKNKLYILDAQEMIERNSGNILETIHSVFLRVPHVILCYSKSYLTQLSKDGDSMEFKVAKYIHDRANNEFFSNNMRNKRFRCVIMPTAKGLESHGWSAVTFSYKFPETFDKLVKRILKPPPKTLEEMEEDESSSSLSCK